MQTHETSRRESWGLRHTEEGMVAPVVIQIQFQKLTLGKAIKRTSLGISQSVGYHVTISFLQSPSQVFS